MQVGDFVYDGYYAGRFNNHHIICSPIEYDLPVEVNWFRANEYCKSISMELPSKEELNLLCKLYKSRPEYFPKREYPWYWSSTESSSTTAWDQCFYYGTQGSSSKNFNYFVRAIRRIKI